MPWVRGDYPIRHAEGSNPRTRSLLDPRFLGDPKEVLTIFRTAERLRPFQQLVPIQITEFVADFFKTPDLQALPQFNGFNKVTSLQKRRMCAGIEPGHAAP